MTLKDKMFEVIDTILDGNISLKKISQTANFCREIAEQEALNFCVWVTMHYSYDGNTHYDSITLNSKEPRKTILELYQKYKSIQDTTKAN